MADNQDFNELVEKAKFLLHMNQAELAQSIGISPQYMSDIIKGRKPKAENKYAEMIRKLCADIENPLQKMTEMNPFFTNFTRQGGPANGDGNEQALAPDGFMTVPGITASPDIPFIQVRGKSMINTKAPNHSIPPGSWIAVQRSIMSTVRWGEVYAMETVDGPIVKKIMPSDKENCIRCVSFNEDYPPFDMPVTDIVGDLFIVKGVVNVQIWN